MFVGAVCWLITTGTYYLLNYGNLLLLLLFFNTAQRLKKVPRVWGLDSRKMGLASRQRELEGSRKYALVYFSLRT